VVHSRGRKRGENAGGANYHHCLGPFPLQFARRSASDPSTS
jgi:hypothetical protein